jgi:hypothetical protein
MEEDDIKTPRVCEACGGLGNPCKWCLDGFQDPDHQEAWSLFRNRMRSISGTYSLLESLMEQIIEKLNSIETEEAHNASIEGKKLLVIWWDHDIDSEERKNVSHKISEFQKKAIEIMMNK